MNEVLKSRNPAFHFCINIFVSDKLNKTKKALVAGVVSHQVKLLFVIPESHMRVQELVWF